MGKVCFVKKISAKVLCLLVGTVIIVTSPVTLVVTSSADMNRVVGEKTSSAFLPLPGNPNARLYYTAAQYEGRRLGSAVTHHDINTALAYLEQRIAEKILHMIWVVLCAVVIMVTIVVIASLWTIRHCTRRMAQYPSEPSFSPKEKQSAGIFDQTDLPQVVTVEEDSQLLSDAGMTLEAILTAMQEVGEVVAAMTVGHLEPTEKTARTIPASAGGTGMRMRNGCQVENREAGAALGDQALTLRRLMALLAPDERHFSEPGSPVSKPACSAKGEPLAEGLSIDTGDYSIH